MRHPFVVEYLAPTTRINRHEDGTATVTWRWRYYMSFRDPAFAAKMAKAIEGRTAINPSFTGLPPAITRGQYPNRR